MQTLECADNMRARDLFLVRSDDANVSSWYGVVESFRQLTTVKHGLHCFSRVKPGWVRAFPHLHALYGIQYKNYIILTN